MTVHTVIRRCGVDRYGRSACAELIRHRLDVDPDVHITAVIPGRIDVARGFRCTHGITYWIPR